MIKYDKGTGMDKNWIICEDQFHTHQLGKWETIFCQGNGYMGIRAATEEAYTGEIRNTFIAGTFNRFDEKETTELPNIPDITGMDIKIDGRALDLGRSHAEDYSRTLNLRTGLLTRTFTLATEEGNRVRFCFKRIVSMDNYHIGAARVEITADRAVHLTVSSGINGMVSNSGFQHFSVLSKRFYEDKLLQGNFRTTESGIGVSVNTGHRICMEGQEDVDVCRKLVMKSRAITITYDMDLEGGRMLAIEKISGIYTSRDKDMQESGAAALMDRGREETLAALESGFDILMDSSERAWQEKVWAVQDIIIESENEPDQLALRFAVYHIAAMTPVHDRRMNIAAKGLTGEGYKGHTFWDTEIFLLPFWIYTNTAAARSLLEYRYLCMDGARQKARDNGYEGAMFPWESAWVTDGEVTPRLGDIDILTGEELKIICGDIEQHITCDVVYGVWEYYQITGDEDFMDRYGYEILFEAAVFWQSRMEWNESLKRYEINNVIGPDEYSEHVNNNAFTNYMVRWNLDMAVRYCDELKDRKPVLWDKLNRKIGLDGYYELWTEKGRLLYLPGVNEQGLLPQDDTYLTLPVIDIRRYKESASRADIIKDYNMEQLSGMQVSKQADVLVLFYLMEHLFPKDIKKKNFYYYEDKCLHDSSLSLSTHAILANDIGEYGMAYDFFQRAAAIDLGTDLNSPQDGVHAASMGGVWQCVVNGFAGVRMVDGELRIEPCLPAAWRRISLTIGWKGARLHLDIDKKAIRVYPENPNDKTLFMCYGKKYKADRPIVIEYGC